MQNAIQVPRNWDEIRLQLSCQTMQYTFFWLTTHKMGSCRRERSQPANVGRGNGPNHDSQPAKGDDQRHVFNKNRGSFVALLLMLILTSTATRIMKLPLNRILELRFCQEYYASHHSSQIEHGGFIPEAKCRLSPIQQRLGWMQGTLDTVILLCGKT